MFTNSVEDRGVQLLGDRLEGSFVSLVGLKVDVAQLGWVQLGYVGVVLVQLLLSHKLLLVLLESQVGLALLRGQLLLLLAAVDDEEHDFVDEADEAHDKTEQDRSQEYVGGVLLVGDLGGRSGALHGSVVEGDEEADELTEVADVGPVVVEGLGEWQVDQIVQQKQDRNAQHDQSRQLTHVLHRHVNAQPSPVKDSHHEVGPLDCPHLHLLLELPEPHLLSAGQPDCHEQRQHQTGNGSHSAPEVQVVLGGVVLEVDARRVGEVEAVEQDEGQQQFLHDPPGESVEAGAAGLAEAAQGHEEEGNGHQAHSHPDHDIAVAQEVGRVTDRADSVWSRREPSPVACVRARVVVLVVELRLIPMHAFHCHHGCEQGVDVVHASHRQMGQLQHSEHLKAYNLTRQGGGSHNAITTVLHGLSECLDGCLLAALVLRQAVGLDVVGRVNGVLNRNQRNVLGLVDSQQGWAEVESNRPLVQITKDLVLINDDSLAFPVPPSTSLNG